MRSSTLIFGYLTNEEKANVIKTLIFLSFLLTRFSNVYGEISSPSSSSSSSDSFGDNFLEQSTNQLLQLHDNHHHQIDSHHQQQQQQQHHHHHHRRRRRHHHRHRHHHGSKLINDHDEIDSRKLSSTDWINKLIKSDGDKLCAGCASLDDKLFIKLKLEAIKNQILSKLHLDTKPNVTTQLTDSMVIDTLLESKSIQLKRDDVSSSFISSSSSSSPSSSILSSLSSSPLISSPNDGFNQPQQQLSQPYLGKSQSSSISNSNQHPLDKQNDSSESADDYYGTTSEIISFPEPGIQINGHTLLEFTLPNTNIDLLDVISAKLWVKVEPWEMNKVHRKPLESQKISLFIFAARNISTSPNLDNNNIKLTGDSLTSIKGVYFDRILLKKVPASIGWKQLDLTSEVQRWFPSRTKLSLMIDCSGCEGKIKFLLFDQNEIKSNNKMKVNSNSKQQQQQQQQSSNQIENNGSIWKGRSSPTHSIITNNNTNNTKQSLSSSLSSSSGSHAHLPYLIIKTRPKNLKRMKREFPSTCDPNFKHCCVQQLYVNFTLLGWDSWIISPPGYHAGYCSGDCSKPMKTPDIYSWYHSYVMDSYRIANPYASISPCCTPTRLEPLEILYWVGHNVVASKLPNMIVKECGCS